MCEVFDFDKVKKVKGGCEKMSNFIIAVGHTASGNVGCGVIARLDESNCTREIGALASKYLQEKGHGVIKVIAIAMRIVIAGQVRLIK